MSAKPKDDMGIHIMKHLQNTLSSSSDLKSQDDITQALINAGLPMNSINEMVESAKDTLLCDSNCQRDKKAKQLRNAVCTAEQTLENAPGNLIDAERNFYVYTKGEKGYEDIMLKKYTNEANIMKEEAVIIHTALMKDISALIDSYKINTTNLSRLNELLGARVKENEQIKKIIYNNTGIAATKQRLVAYEDKEIDWLSTVRKTLIYCCVIVFILYLIFSDFIKNARYKSKQELSFILLSLIYILNVDRFSKWTFLFIHKIIYFYNYIAPKNVYTNL